MDQAQKCMWLIREDKFQSPFSASLNKNFNMRSWEERAFAEDAVGSLGNYIWPPRLYSCTFCKREFRSAQALGGHMNIHRRERARLKQSTRTTFLGDQYCPQTIPCSNVFNANLLPVRFSALSYPPLENFKDQVSPSAYNALVAQEPQRVFAPTYSKPGAKRHKADVSSLSTFLKPYSANDGYGHVEEETTMSKQISVEGLDLELRLGDLPKLN